MLTRFALRDFKSYRKATLDFAPLTVLIGANASGKSNALEGVRLLSWIAQGNRLGSIRYAVHEGDQAIRGTVASLGRDGANIFTLACETEHPDWPCFSISLRIDGESDLHIVDERVTSPTSSVPLYEVLAPGAAGGNDLSVAYNNFARGGTKPRTTCTDQLAILHQLQGSARFEEGHRKAHLAIPEVCRFYQNTLSDILFLDPQPALMRGYSYKTEQRLKGDGANLSGVLYALKDEMGDEILGLIRSLPEQDIRAMTFIETPRNEVMVELEETFGGVTRKFDATLLSDGTLRVLAIAAALLSAPPGSLVVIEEIDNGLHPSRVGDILARLLALSRHRGLQILISSHNPALLDALPDETIPSVVFCYRDPDDGSSRLVRLQDLERYPELIAQGTVGHLLTRGILDRLVKNTPSPEVRRQRAKAWLDDLRRSMEAP
ncbi:AAA family ATPase [Pararhodospirillum oryzae]|uniref:ATPase AAA-type core domain-containing protein n=1 Tax=Pararhodospirillum oryzae TaxID=478448 RepID=A0A512H8A8_9PROT|nr:ATP-binding protein [Pararhodospirillum oryzae]GEO81685.1 hypothetical protein ROR02_18160 [Pararhodospirillum oryzae]